MSSLPYESYDSCHRCINNYKWKMNEFVYNFEGL